MSNSDQEAPTQQPAEFIDLPDNLPGDDTPPQRPRTADGVDEVVNMSAFEPLAKQHSFGILRGITEWWPRVWLEGSPG